MSSSAPNVGRSLKSFPPMENKFERALMDYGSQILTVIFQYALSTERYEDCAVIKRLFEKYHLDLNQSMEEYQSYFWRLGMSGRTAIANMDAYLSEALAMVGYPADAIKMPAYSAI